MYCTRADIEKSRVIRDHLLQLVDDEGEGEFYDGAGATPPSDNTQPLYSDSDSLINSRIQKCIGEADSVIDAALRGVYALPISGEIPTLLTTIAVDLSTFYLHARRRPIPDDVIKLYDHADALLKRIANRQIVLHLPTADAADQTTVPAFAVYSRPRVFE
jgi:phage gp36-like protein